MALKEPEPEKIYTGNEKKASAILSLIAKRCFSIVPRYIDSMKCVVRNVYTRATIQCISIYRLGQRNFRMRDLNKGEEGAVVADLKVEQYCNSKLCTFRRLRIYSI